MGLKNYIIHDGIDSVLIEKMKKFRYDHVQHLQVREKIIRHNFFHLDLYLGTEKIKNISVPCYDGLIHFIWISDNPSEIIPKRYLPYIQTFKNMNPKAKIKIWNQKDILPLLTNKRYLEFYQNLPKHIHRADFSKYLIIYLFGGLYCDLDFFCVHNLYDLVYDKDVAFFFEPKEHAKLMNMTDMVLCGFFFSKMRNHTVFLKIVEDTIKNYDKRNNEHKNQSVYTTGPVVLSELYYSGVIHKKMIFNSHYVIPITSQFVSSKNKFSRQKLQNMDKISFVYTLWTEGHWDLENDRQKNNVNQTLQYYITHPDEYHEISSKGSENKNKFNIKAVIIVLVCVLVLLGMIILLIFFIK